eukprot:1478953-Pleurochrysis_carterae.AAC.1
MFTWQSILDGVSKTGAGNEVQHIDARVQHVELGKRTVRRCAAAGSSGTDHVQFLRHRLRCAHFWPPSARRPRARSCRQTRSPTGL